MSDKIFTCGNCKKQMKKVWKSLNTLCKPCCEKDLRKVKKKIKLTQDGSND